MHPICNSGLISRATFTANALATTGSYSSAFPFLGALCIVGLVLLSLAWMFFKKMKAKDAAEA